MRDKDDAIPRLDDLDPQLLAVLESAARLQELVPDAVLVGGTAAALYARHRLSEDHDHVVADLRDRFDLVLDALEREPDWVTNRVTAGKIVLGQIGEIESGVRQLIRKTPLETQALELPSGRTLVVPTPEETLRTKAFLLVKRNQVRDYLDVAALSERYGIPFAAQTLGDMDRFYADETVQGMPVSSQVTRQLGEPRPADTATLKSLHVYKGLGLRWQEWSNVVQTCRDVAAAMVNADG
jgi:hypothetical protein